ncbi:MAG: universal stress protein [Candidatus Methylomirabilis sp.]|nr:universal stress protein [Deltaproteobacteria bacterium]
MIYFIIMKLESILAIGGGERQEAALECAARLARHAKASLVLADALEDLPANLKGDNSFMDLWNRVAREEGDELESSLDSLSSKGVSAEARLLIGTPFIEIIREVLRGGHDLVVKGSERTGRLRGAFLGSNDMHLLRKCPCPVLITKPSKGCHFERILAAVDPDPYHPERNALNVKILEAAATIAKAWGGVIHVVHAWELLSESLYRVRSLLSSQDLEAYLNETHALHARWLKEIVEKAALSGLRHETHLVKGSPWDIIPAMQKEKKAGLVVMGTVGRAGLPGLLIGNTAERILGKITSSVLAIKPDGFVSPVQP